MSLGCVSNSALAVPLLSMVSEMTDSHTSCGMKTVHCESLSNRLLNRNNVNKYFSRNASCFSLHDQFVIVNFEQGFPYRYRLRRGERSIQGLLPVTAMTVISTVGTVMTGPFDFTVFPFRPLETQVP